MMILDDAMTIEPEQTELLIDAPNEAKYIYLYAKPNHVAAQIEYFVGETLEQRTLDICHKARRPIR